MTANQRTCANPDCDNIVPRRQRTGRPAIYCSTSCRPSAQHTAPTITVEIGHPDRSPDGRPPQRVWTVRLRRGTHTVTIADNLGWPTAAALAEQLDSLIHGQPSQKRDAPR
jgi:hypothetical protein